MQNSNLVMVRAISDVLTYLSEKDHFCIELLKMGITLEDIPQNLSSFHEALKSTFGKHHFSVECQIIKSLHENVKKGVYKEKDASVVAIQLIDVFTKEHKKEIAATKAALSQSYYLGMR